MHISKKLQPFVGYENDYGELANIAEQNGQLIFQRPNGGINNLHYAGNNEFFLDDKFYRVEFTKAIDSKIKNLKLSKVEIGTTEWFKTARPLLKLSPERIADSLLKRYIGKYFLTANDTLLLTRITTACIIKWATNQNNC